MTISKFLVISVMVLAVSAPATTYPLEELYRQSQIDFHRKDYQKALPELQSYIEQSESKSYTRERLLWVMDQVGFIFLRVRKDSVAAIQFFEKISKDKRLDEAQQDNVSEWLAAAREWHKSGAAGKSELTVDQLYSKGQQYFTEGRKRSKYPADNSGNAHFHIAATYLLPFIIHHDHDTRMPEALIMMGTIRTHIQNDLDYLSENFYFKEAIRRKPHSKIAMEAYRGLEEHVRFGYSGSGGDNTPSSVVAMLRNYKKLAEPLKVAKKTTPPAQKN